MLVVFWGPVHGQVHTTSNMVAIATMLALDYHIQILLTHTHFEKSTLEIAYSKLRQIDMFRESAGGLDGVQRPAECGLLTPDKVRDNAESLVKDRLDMLAGSSNHDPGHLVKVMPLILDAAQRSYELVFIDVSSGSRNELSNLAMQYADVIVINLNQNVSVLNAFFEGKARNKYAYFVGKKLVYCIGAYHRSSKLSCSRIASEHRIPAAQIGKVPFNVRYLDSQNEQHIIKYLIRARSRKKKFLEFNEEVYFTEEVRGMGKKILAALGIMETTLGEEMYV